LAGLAGNNFLTKNMFQHFFEMKTFTTSSTSKNTLSSLLPFKLGNIWTSHNHLLAIFWDFYYDATKLLQTHNCVKIASKTTVGVLVKLKRFASVLSERFRLNYYFPLVEYVFIAQHT